MSFAFFVFLPILFSSLFCNVEWPRWERWTIFGSWGSVGLPNLRQPKNQGVSDAAVHWRKDRKHLFRTLSDRGQIAITSTTGFPASPNTSFRPTPDSQFHWPTTRLVLERTLGTNVLTTLQLFWFSLRIYKLLRCDFQTDPNSHQPSQYNRAISTVPNRVIQNTRRTWLTHAFRFRLDNSLFEQWRGID